MPGRTLPCRRRNTLSTTTARAAASAGLRAGLGSLPESADAVPAGTSAYVGQAASRVHAIWAG